MQRFDAKDFVLLGLNREEDTEREARFAREHELPYPVLLGMGRTFRDYWAEGIPYTVLIDREGIVRRRWTGFGAGMEEEIAREVERLVARDE